MGTAQATIDLKDFDRFMDHLEKYRGDSEKLINEYLAGTGYEKIRMHIRDLLPVSGRTWKRKKTAARTASPEAVFRPLATNLAVTTYTRTNYNYLYFPDDGSNTRRHAGNQQFMLGGAQAAGEEIVDDLCARLAAAFEEA